MHSELENRIEAPSNRFIMRGLLIALTLLIIATSFVELNLPAGDLIQISMVTIVFLWAAWVTKTKRRLFVITLGLAVLAVSTRWLDHFRPGVVPPGLYIMFGTPCLTIVFLQLMVFIFRAPRVDSEVLSAGIAGYLLLVIIWATLYLLISKLQPSAFQYNVASAGQTMNGFTAVYFSFGVMGTVGFGDIVPVASSTRLLAVFEATTGLFYVAILISRLVGLYAPQRVE